MSFFGERPSVAQEILRKRQRQDKISKAIASWVVAGLFAALLAALGAPTWAIVGLPLTTVWAG